MEPGYRLRLAADRGWEAVLDDAAIGSAHIGPEGLEVVVDPVHRRKGVGRCLVRAVVSGLLKQGVDALSARATEVGGCAFLESLGAKPLGEGRYAWTDLSAVAKCAS